MKVFTPTTTRQLSINDILELLNRGLSGFNLIEEHQLTDDVAQTFVDQYFSYDNQTDRNSFCINYATNLINERVYVEVEDYYTDIHKALHIVSSPQFTKHNSTTPHEHVANTIRDALKELLP